MTKSNFLLHVPSLFPSHWFSTLSAELDAWPVPMRWTNGCMLLMEGGTRVATHMEDPAMCDERILVPQ
jgi:hypothetical protein